MVDCCWLYLFQPDSFVILNVKSRYFVRAGIFKTGKQVVNAYLIPGKGEFIEPLINF